MTDAPRAADSGSGGAARRAPGAGVSAAAGAGRFGDAYEGAPPWDIDGPQPVVVELAEAGRITGPVLDAGCGTGENALYLAGRGFEVVGVDFVAAAVEAARGKARSRGLQAEFLVLDALRLGELGRTFATVLDSGLFHVFGDDDARRYAGAVAAVLRPDGRCFVHGMSDVEPRPGPPPVTQAGLRAAFDRPPLRVVSIEAAVMLNRDGETRHAWLAVVERERPSAGASDRPPHVGRRPGLPARSYAAAREPTAPLISATLASGSSTSITSRS